MARTYDTDDSMDPDYRESSDDSDEDDLPLTLARQRADWIVEHVDVLESMYTDFKEKGEACFGNAFFQTGNINAFSKLVFKYTMPGAASP